ncbi:hypothetical protein M440DRAFT_1388686 [Trichoderma longibrachiatum ATCC 18648]|uniref:Uncharacterized protein n=1 Tax=Trichoderma longibrachiatum ATCC 18648 TaxID=983965 RepID=A0A2T4CFR6_TRILO|nr:hypothetical protein M440DRAFT_1388686 [Trichoderma longibrachiatum ATCC 18648]
MSSSGGNSTTPITSIDSATTLSDNVVPTAEQSASAFDFSRSLWQGLVENARCMSLSRDTLDLMSLARHGPKMPDDMEETSELAGYAKWHLSEGPKPTGPGNVLHPARLGMKRRWDLMKHELTECELSDRSSFGFSDSESNGLAIMFLAWSYILSVFLLEEQKTSFVYTEATAASGTASSADSDFTIDLGDASDEEYRWWSTLLSPGQGWKASCAKQPVWAVKYTGNVKFSFKNPHTEPLSPDIKPPSSRQAVAFLARFAAMYDLEGQARLALSMALTIPLHDKMMSTIQLPKPRLVKLEEAPPPSSLIDKEFRLLSYYMVLSSNPTFLGSALWSVFWEPAIDCNLASSWCTPIIQEIQPLIESEDLETLSHVLAQRRPGVAPLWYGLLACGITDTVSAIVPFLEKLYTHVPTKFMPEVAVWTDSPQSFMDLPGSGPYVEENKVSRADVWRLRHEYWNAWKGGIHFRNLPSTPFQPFGAVDAEEVELMVRGHLQCPRHEWVYSGFTWTTRSRIELTHEPRVLTTSWKQFEADSRAYTPPRGAGEPDHEMDYRASKRAVGDMFRWAATEMDPSGKHIYSHPWVEMEAHLAMGLDEKQESDGPVRLSELSMDRIKEWVVNSEGDIEQVPEVGEAA